MSIFDTNGAIACAECGRQARAVRDRLKTENAKLQAEIAELEGTIECLQGLADATSAENAQLRELVRDMWSEGMCECGSLGKCESCIYDYPSRMRELGIEVDR